MKKIKYLLIILSISSLMGVLHADGLEIAPFYGLRFGGVMKTGVAGDTSSLGASGATGATINIPLPIQEKLELLYSHQETDFSVNTLNTDVQTRVDVYQAGLLREYTMYDEFRPFLVGTLGMSHFSFSSSLKDQNLFSVGLGGGFKYFPSEHVGFRLDGRAYVSFVEGSGAIACSGGCTVSYQGSVFLQGEITPSIVVVF